MQLRDFPSTFVSFLCGLGTFHQLFVQLPNLTSIYVNFLCCGPFCQVLSTSVNFPGGHWTFCQLHMLSLYLQSTFNAAGGLSVLFRQLTVRPQDLLATAINFPCGCRTFHHHSVLPVDLWSTSVNFLATFRQLPAPVRAAKKPSINFRQLSVRLRDLPSASVNLPCCCGTFHQLPSTFCSAAGPSINFRQLLSTFRADTGHFINFPYFAGPSVNFHHFYMLSSDLPSAYVNFLYGCRTFHLLSV